jgi:peptidoglycan/LPS O-acetylase OafA/YrhL
LLTAIDWGLVGPLLGAILALSLPYAISLPLFLLATLATAMAAYKLIENPMITLGKHLTRR